MLLQKDGIGNRTGQVSGLAEQLTWAKPLLNFASNNFLPLGNNFVMFPYFLISFITIHHFYNYYLLVMVYLCFL